jgi:hypothetical protein
MSFAARNRQPGVLGIPRIHSRQLAKIEDRPAIRRDPPDVPAMSA